jgi:hypothetical protein
VSTWDDLSDKPTVLTPPGFSAGNFPSAEQLASADIASALGHTPGLSGGIQTSVRASGSATDEALATEQAIREAVNAVGAESLSDLSDVTLNDTTKYEPNDILAGNGSGKYVDKGINNVLSEASLGSLGSVSTTARDDGDVLQWVDGNLQYQHVSPADLIAGSVGLDDLTDVTLNDTTKYEPQDVLAGNGNGEFVDKTIDTVLGEAEVQDLGNIADPSTDGNVIADQGGTYGAEAITSVTSGHVDWTDLQNVNHSNLKEPQVGFYDSDNSKWINGFIADLIRERGSLSVGDVSFAATWRTIESDTEPTQRPNGNPLQEGDVWIDTDAQPVAEAYVFRNGTFQKTASAIGGNNIITDSIDADKITADTITANEIQADTITANEITANTITANQISANTITAGEITADTITSTEIQADAITGDLIDATTSITVGNSAPNILIDGSVDPSRIESTNFASLTSGFRIQSDGFAEFGDIRARGAIRSAVFERDEQVLRGGTDIVTPSTTLAQDASSGDTTIEVENVPFSAGDDVRFKEAGTTEIRTISGISGTTLTLNSSLNNNWTSGAAIARTGAERIINSADSQFAPFTSYLNDQGQEQVRIGNLAGVSGRSGYGLQVGGGKLFYDSADDLLSVKGDVFAERGEIGPFSINERGLSGSGTNLNATSQSLGFFDTQNGSDLTGNYTNPDFSSGSLTGWTQVFDVDVFNDGSDYVVRPNELTITDGNPDRYQYTGEVSQSADLSAFSGETVTFSFDFKKVSSAGVKKRISVAVTDKNTGDTLATSFREILEEPTENPVTIQAELPGNASNIEASVRIENINYTSPPPQEPQFNKLEVFSGSILASYSASETALFDSAGNKNVSLDGSSGNIESKGNINASGKVTGGRVGAEKNGGVGSFIKPGTSTKDNVDITFLELDVIPKTENTRRDHPPTPPSGKIRLYANSDNNEPRLYYINSNGNKFFIT